MPGFVTSNMAEVPPEAQHTPIDLQTAPPGTAGEIAENAFARGPLPSYLRYMYELGQKTRDAYIDPQPRMQPADIKEQYGLDAKAPMPEYQAQYMAHAQELEKRGQMLTQNASGVKSFVANTGAWLADPINLGSMFVPFIGEERAAGAVTAAGLSADTLAGRSVVRAITYGSQGALSQVPLSAIKYGLSKTTGVDYSVASAMHDVLFAGLVGSGVGPLAGAIGDAIRGGAPEWAKLSSQKYSDKKADAETGLTQLARENPVDIIHPDVVSNGVMGMTDKELTGVTKEAEQATREEPVDHTEALADLKERGDAIERQMAEAHKDNPEMLEQMMTEPQAYKAQSEITDKAYTALQHCLMS
jgi:hypothetical protein